MFAELNELLGASVEKPEQGKLTLLCSEKTDASFLLHHFLSFYLKAGCKVCFVALLQSFSHYNLVAQKLGVSLAAAKERGQLVFLEGLKTSNDILFGQEQQQELTGEASPFQFLSGDGSNLKALYEFVCSALSPVAGGDSWKCPVLLVDNLGILLGLGVRLTDILDFIHYCRVTVNAQLKLSIIQRSSWERKAERDLLRIYQYKIQDRNVVFFARGMSAAVL
ncbi:elongator complex protein 6 isoform X2 [Podarcis muralis]